MTTLTSIVASVVVNSSAAALSHFGLNVEPVRLEKPPVVSERVVARSHPQPQKVASVAPVGDPCPKLHKA
jgi:hypothetical protein